MKRSECSKKKNKKKQFKIYLKFFTEYISIELMYHVQWYINIIIWVIALSLLESRSIRDQLINSWNETHI